MNESVHVGEGSATTESGFDGGSLLLQSLPYDYTFILDVKHLATHQSDPPPADMTPSFLYGCSQWNKLLADNIVSRECWTEFVNLCRLMAQETRSSDTTSSGTTTVCPNKKQVELLVNFQEANASLPLSPEYWNMTLFPVYKDQGGGGGTAPMMAGGNNSPGRRVLTGIGGLVHRSKFSSLPKQEEGNAESSRPVSDLRAIVDSSASASALLDRQGTLLEYSSSFGARFGIPKEYGVNLWNIDKSASMKRLKDAVTEAWENPLTEGTEVKYKEVNPATDAWTEYRISIVAVPERNLQAALVECRTISVGIQVENNYKEGMEHYSGIFRNMPLGFSVAECVTHEDGTRDYRFLEVNEQFEAMTGLSCTTSVGKCARELLPGIQDDPADWIGRVFRVGMEGETDEFTQYSVILKKWYKGIIFPSSSGKVVTLFMDITDQEEREQALRESEEKHRHLFETMNQGVTYASADGSYSDANQAALEMLGLTLDQFQGRTSIDPRWNTIREDGSDWPSEDHPINEVFKTGQPIENVVMGVFNPMKEEYRWIVLDLFPRFRPGESLPYQCCNILSDITETRKTENTLLKAKEAAEEADKLKSAFLATMSHEIRTPLNGLMGNLDLVLSNGLDEDHKEENLEGLKVAMQSGKLLISIIEDILDLSKIEAGQLDISHESFSVAAMMDQTMQLARAYQIQRKKGHVELHQEVAQLPSEFAYGDEFRLQQILVNLLSNAIKFTDEGIISLTVAYEDGNLSFCVLDTGKGIPEEKLSIIFDPFRQVELSDTREHGGTGLGLTICRKLVELMGGTLTVESQISGPDQGSKFYVKIPFEAAQYKPLSRGHNSHGNLQRALSVSSETASYQKILIAEDDPVSRRVVAKMLEKAGQEFLVAKNGLEAVEMFGAHRHEIALTLMDVMMPGIDGLEASKRIRQMEAAENAKRQVPIIALSAGAMKGDKEKGMEYGMTDYLTKPISYKALVATLDAYLG